MERCEEFLCSEASSVRLYAIAQQYNLQRLKESVMTYLQRAPVSRLRNQSEWDELDSAFVKQLLTDRCERFETHLDALREVRMVLERKRPTTFPGQHLLCASCTAAREQQVAFKLLCLQHDTMQPSFTCSVLRSLFVVTTEIFHIHSTVLSSLSHRTLYMTGGCHRFMLQVTAIDFVSHLVLWICICHVMMYKVFWVDWQQSD